MDEAEAVVVSAVLPLPKSGTGDQRLMNTGEKDAEAVAAAAATMENIAGAEHLAVATVSRGEEGVEEDMHKPTTTVKGDPLLIMAPIPSPHLRPRRTPRTQRRLSLSHHRTHSLLHPLLHHPCIRLLL